MLNPLIKQATSKIYHTMTQPNDSKIQPPADCICPLTKELMKDPVISRYGDSFERKAILEWLEQGNDFCPVTSKPLRPSSLVSNKSLDWKIRCWLHKHGFDAPDHEEPEFLHDFHGFVAITPAKLICPLTKKVMVDPVMTHEGQNFERKAILKYLDDSDNKCPVTGNPLAPHDLVSNHNLKHEIHVYHEKIGDEESATLLKDEVVEANEHHHHEALVGTRGDHAVEELRAEHVERQKKQGIVEIDYVSDPFSASAVIDEKHGTLKSLGHVF
jgi:hypothetical protein